MWQPLVHSQVLVDNSGFGTRTVSARVHSDTLELAPMSSELRAKWDSGRVESGYQEPGSIDVIRGEKALVTTDVMQATRAWLAAHNVHHTESSSSALGCEGGAAFHHDAAYFPDAVFFVVWLSEEAGWDLLFPQIHTRIELGFGSIVLFDAAQPHGVVKRGESAFDRNAFPGGAYGAFLSLDLRITRSIRQLLGIETYSCHGRKGFFKIGNDGEGVSGDKVDDVTGAWSVRPFAKPSDRFQGQGGASW